MARRATKYKALKQFDHAVVSVHRSSEGAYLNNSYLVADPETRRAALIDPFYGAEATWIPVLEERGLTLESILLTHAHIDHVCGVAPLLRRFPDLAVWLHADGVALAGGSDDLRLTGGVPSTVDYAKKHDLPLYEPFEPTHALSGGRPVTLGAVSIEVLDVPGHCPGHVAFLAGDVLFSGDVIYAGTVGYTHIPGSDPDLLAESIRTKILTLPDDTFIYPGHGRRTSVGRERENNPFVIEMLSS